MRKILFILLIIPFNLFAVQDFYVFATPEQQKQFTTLTTELRCLVCQNQNLAESNAPLASDLRDQIFQHIQLGQSNKQIIDYLVSRYGNFILYRPPLNVTTFGLWFGPFIFLLFSVSYLFYYLYSRKK
ncbi:MAG: hypothetical protein ACD_45C00365G0002 [uncultured bacterium]|nr:MAG: hypothetical protein ACD_45C00365G0002 [uncultured bacterium]